MLFLVTLSRRNNILEIIIQIYKYANIHIICIKGTVSKLLIMRIKYFIKEYREIPICISKEKRLHYSIVIFLFFNGG